MEQAGSGRNTDLNLGVLLGLPQSLSCARENTTSSSSGLSDVEYGASQESDAPFHPRALRTSRAGTISDLLSPFPSPVADGQIAGSPSLHGMFIYFQQDMS